MIRKRPWNVPIGLAILCTALLLTASTAFAVATADIQITKSNDTGGTLVAGGTVHYTITATNLGPNGASQVVIEDDLDSHISSVSGLAVTQPSQCVQAGTPIVITCNMQGLGASGSINTINFDAVVDPSTPKGTIIQNCPFELSSNSTDPDHTNDSAPFSCDGAGFEITIDHNLAVTKTRTSPDPATVTTIPGGTSVTYDIVATNNGPSPILQADMSVTDTLSGTVSGSITDVSVVSGNLDCGTGPWTSPVTCTATADWASGDSAEFTVTVLLDNTGSGTITNTATVPITDDSDTSDNTSSVTDDVCQSVDLAITKACDSFCPPVASSKPTAVACEPTPITTIQGGSDFQYDITVSNNDPSVTAHDVLLTDALPSGVSFVEVLPSNPCVSGSIPTNDCDLGDITNASPVSFSIHVTAVESGPVENSASVAATECDRDTANNSDSCSVTVETNNMPTALEVDREGCTNVGSPFCTGDPDSVATDSDVNRVFEANELVRMDPTWENTLNNDVAVTGTISGFTGPNNGHVVYFDPAVDGDATADYGTIPGNGTSDCNSTGDCYELHLTLDDPANRPAAHWDATVLETLSTGETKTWTLHIGDSFSDVLRNNLFYRQIETIYHNHIALGCLTGFCPTLNTRRDELAAFVARSIEGSDAAVPVTDGATYNCVNAGSSNFLDIDPTSVFCRHTNFLFVNEISFGCGGGDFCPEDSVLRRDAAIFVARGMNVKAAQPAEPVPNFGTDGGTRSYNCDSIDHDGILANTPPFPDVATGGEPCPAIGFLWVNHVVNGDINGDFRPNDPIRRDETATVLSNAFVSLPLYGPLNP